MPDQRILIIGNCGTGKSTLAGVLRQSVGLEPTSLDDLHWLPGHIGQKRDKAEVLSLLGTLAEKPGWIAEGVFGWMAEELLVRATQMIWLDYPWDVTAGMLQSRGPKMGESATVFKDLVAWAADYWKRDSSSSHGGHLALFERFTGKKFRLSGPDEIKTLF